MAIDGVTSSSGESEHQFWYDLCAFIKMGAPVITYFLTIFCSSPTYFVMLQILIQSVCETMVPKLVAEDIPLLFSLLNDVFPQVTYSRAEMTGKNHVSQISPCALGAFYATRKFFRTQRANKESLPGRIFGMRRRR